MASKVEKNCFFDIFLGIVALFCAVTGILMFTHPAFISQIGLQVRQLHIACGLLFILLALIHVLMHLKPFFKTIFGNGKKVMLSALIIILSIAVCAGATKIIPQPKRPNFQKGANFQHGGNFRQHP